MQHNVVYLIHPMVHTDSPPGSWELPECVALQDLPGLSDEQILSIQRWLNQKFGEEIKSYLADVQNPNWLDE